MHRTLLALAATDAGNAHRACRRPLREAPARLREGRSPAATLNSPIRGRVKFPQLTAAERCVFTRSERALQLERRPLSDASSCLRTSADASDASGGRAAA